jgi:hypothetical protein
MDWILSKWYDKAIYVLGWIWLVLFVIGFVIGFLRAV